MPKKPREFNNLLTLQRNIPIHMAYRTAIDTIKGYFYQFDYAIAKLLELKQDTDTIIVERN